MMRQDAGNWFTCTPVRFRGDHTFFARDSGLLCKGFQEIGISCKAIMPGPPMDGDQTEDLIRTDYRNLEDAGWWRSLGGDGVVFYGWGSGKYVRIVRAIKRAGLLLVSHMDTAGMLGILNGFPEFTGMLWRVTTGERGRSAAGVLRFACRLAYSMSLGLVRNDIGRARHLRLADLIGAITPVACDRVGKVCRIYGGKSLARRVRLLPHANASYMKPDTGIPKERLVVAVGRWDDAMVKGTALLLETVRLVLDGDDAAAVEIYGRTTPAMNDWHGSLPQGLRERVRLAGVVPNTEVMRGLQRARVSLCTSLRESYHGVSAEALCCGCSVVGPDVPEIPSMKWFTDGPFGRMADRTAGALARAVRDELAAWDRQERDAAAIADHWSRLLHAPRVAEEILRLAADVREATSC